MRGPKKSETLEIRLPHALKMVYRGGRSSRSMSGGGFIYDASVGVCS